MIRYKEEESLSEMTTICFLDQLGPSGASAIHPTVLTANISGASVGTRLLARDGVQTVQASRGWRWWWNAVGDLV